MAFWGDLKKITTSSVKAIGDGVELFAECAESTERFSHYLLLSTKAARLESALERLALNDAGFYACNVQWRELSGLYDQLWEGAEHVEREKITEKRKKYDLLVSNASIGELKGSIERQKRLLDETVFPLPVEKMTAIKSLQSLQHQLASAYEKRGDARRSAMLRDDAQRMDSTVAALELQRDQVEIEYYPNGKTQRQLEKRDGQLNGYVKAWYPTGELEYQISFRDGAFTDKAESWRTDGTPVCEVVHLDEGSALSIWLASGEKIVEGKVEHNNGYFSVWLRDGYSLGKVTIKDGQASKVLFMLSLLLKPGFWLRIVQQRKRAVLKDSIPPFRHAFDEGMKLFNQVIQLRAKR